MKKILSASIIMLWVLGSAQAKTVYVTDNINLSLRSEESEKGKVMKLLPTGTPLTVISQNKKSGFSRVRLQTGEEGFFPTRSTMKEPPSRFQLETATKNLSAIKTENASLKAELESLKKALTPDTTLEQSLANERDLLSRELDELKKTAANAIQIKEERDELQEHVVNIERELEQLKLDNKALKDSTEQDWFLYGGAVAFIGVLLGFILPRIAWQRRSGGWDSFH
ncbi:MAG: TIGR04211 family SH3 domain-containing protein [Gammaproteobacteria bacterium]